MELQQQGIRPSFPPTLHSRIMKRDGEPRRGQGTKVSQSQKRELFIQKKKKEEN